MMKVVGYYDLRPVDWASGKRLPLEAGAGHICDRCGAEHAIVYVLEDTETHKQFSVGSGCAKKQWGFDPEKTDEAKRIIKSQRAAHALDLHQHRHAMAAKLAEEIADRVAMIRIPTLRYEPLPNKWTGKIDTIWTCDDANYRQMPGTTDAEAKSFLISRWLENRIAEAIPVEWREITLGSQPNRPKSYQTTLDKLCGGMSLKLLKRRLFV